MNVEHIDIFREMFIQIPNLSMVFYAQTYFICLSLKYFAHIFFTTHLHHPFQNDGIAFNRNANKFRQKKNKTSKGLYE